VTVPVILDSLLEGNESLTLSIRETLRGVFVDNARRMATGIIEDSTGKYVLIKVLIVNMFTVAVKFEQDTYSVNENSGSLSAALTLDRSFSTPVFVMVQAHDITATGMHYFVIILVMYCSSAPSDYGPQQSYNVTIPDGSTRWPFIVSIVNDANQEPAETFFMNITSVGTNGVAIGTPSRTNVTIVDTTGKYIII